MNMYHKVQQLVTALEEDFFKFYDKSNKAAGTRVRKGLQELKNLAQEVRSDIQQRKQGNSA